MNFAALYNRINDMQRRDAKNFLEEYTGKIQWRLDGRDRLIDVGCGSGNVLVDLVHPLLPKDFEQVVGVDISPEMVNFARENYGLADRTSFQILDICIDAIPRDLQGSFDHVTSFYCLNYVSNLQKALDNIYQLLRDNGGDCLLLIKVSHTSYDIFQALKDDSKWSEYMLDNFISPLNSSEDPVEDLQRMLKKAGFVDSTVDIKHGVNVFEGVQKIREAAKTLVPSFDRIPEELRESYFAYVLNALEKMGAQEHVPDKNDYKFSMPYKSALVYARKAGGSGLTGED